MSDTSAAPAAAAPAAPAPQAASTPAAGAPPAAKTHHSATQPREVGKFAGPPGQTDPQTAVQTPRVLKAMGREIPEDEALAILEDKLETQRLTQAEAQELARLRQEAERWKDPRTVLTPEQQEQIAVEAFRRWQEREEEKKLPPEVQRFRQEQRRLAKERADFERQRQEEQNKRTEAQNAALREQCVSNVRATLSLLGEEEKPGLVFREVTRAWAESAAAGRNDSPRVIAHRVQQRLDALAEGRAVQRGPNALFTNEKMVAALNAMKPEELAEHFERLAPFFEAVRAANLQKRGLSVVPGGQQAQRATSTVPTPAALADKAPRTTQEWQQFFREGGQPDTPERHAAYWRLKDAGAL